MLISEKEIVLIQKQDGFDREKFNKWWKEMEKTPISYGKVQKKIHLKGV